LALRLARVALDPPKQDPRFNLPRPVARAEHAKGPEEILRQVFGL
jgi:hypothetical protein